MTLRAAVQMDPMDDINIGGDSSFHLILKALERGYELYHYDVRGLTWEAGRLTTKAHRIAAAQREAGAHYKFGDEVLLDLGRDVDVVLMRQDPPFDLGYLTGTWLLERIGHETLVVNDPASVRNAPEKVFVLDFPEYMPPTMVTRPPSRLVPPRASHASARA